MVKGFPKMYNFSFFGQIFFCNLFYYVTGFCEKKINFCKFANIFADSKSKAQELSNDVSFVIFGHQTWDLEGPSISWFSSTPAEIGLKNAEIRRLFPSYQEEMGGKGRYLKNIYFYILCLYICTCRLLYSYRLN